jgi:hypothetical protein
MTRRRLAATTVLVFAMLGVSPAVALADTSTPSPSGYAATNPSLSLSSAVTVVGKGIVVSGSGFSGGETIAITATYGSTPKALGSTRGGIAVTTAAFSIRPAATTPTALAYANADASGAFSQRVTLTQVGTATITATGGTSGITRSSIVTVRSVPAIASTSKSSAMPFGWTSAVIFAVVAIVILSLLGTAFARRRQHTPAHAPTYETDDVPAPMA